MTETLGQLKGIEGNCDKAPEPHLLLVGGKGHLSWGLFPASGKEKGGQSSLLAPAIFSLPHLKTVAEPKW